MKYDVKLYLSTLETLYILVDSFILYMQWCSRETPS